MLKNIAIVTTLWLALSLVSDATPKKLTNNINKAKYSLYEGVKKNTKASITYKDGFMEVNGAISRPFAVDRVETAEINGAISFYIPKEKTKDWASVSLTFYGEGDKRCYIMTIVKSPNKKYGNCSVGTYPSSMQNMKLTPGNWYRMRFKCSYGVGSVKIWQVKSKEPISWGKMGSINMNKIIGVGVRTYGEKFLINDLKISSKQIPPIKAKSKNGNLGIVLANDGHIISMKHSAAIHFRNDNHCGPAWLYNEKPVTMECVDRKKLQFMGKHGNLQFGIKYQIKSDRLEIKASITNNSDATIKNINSGIRVGLDTYMEKYPDWHYRLFPTLLRCEKSHFWGYFMGPNGKIILIAIPEPVASYQVNYKKHRHRIYTTTLNLLHPAPLPTRHPSGLNKLLPNETKTWTIYLQPLQDLSEVKPKAAQLTVAPMIDAELYTINKGEEFKGRVFSGSSPLKKIEVTTPTGVIKSIQFRNKEVGTDAFIFNETGEIGIYKLLAYSVNGKISEAKLAVRPPWSWYLKQARRNAVLKEQKASSHTESWYGLFSAYLARLHFPDEELDKKIDAKFSEIWSLMYDTKKMLPSSWHNRIQNHSCAAGLLSDKYKATGDIKDLEFAATLVDFLLTKQSTDGAYRNHGTHYTSVIYVAKSIMEVIEEEKKLAKTDEQWKIRYRRHLASVKRAIDELCKNLDNIETEGEMTYEDGMISCSYTQLAMYALYYASPEDKQKYIDAAEYLVNGHRCLSQLKVPDCRMNGGSLRFWESQYDILTTPNMMNSPHGWSGWRIYGLWYLYQLTGKENYLKQVYNALGACCQLVDFKTGDLRWAFIRNPYINANVWAEDRQNPGKGKMVKKIIGEQYMPMISKWYKAPKGKWVTGYWGKQDGGCCDNDVHEIFKCLEETALTYAYIIERANGELVGYNCKVKKTEKGVIVTPYEKVINAVHINLQSDKSITCKFFNKTITKNLSNGMHWIKEK